MSTYSIPLAKQELLNHMLQVGGKAVCYLHRPEQVIQADFEVELTENQARCTVELGGHTGEITLRRSDRANHLHLRDFIQDIANGRHESAAPVDPQPGPITPLPLLSISDERTLRSLCQFGGAKTLENGIAVSVHRTHHSSKGTAHAIASRGTDTHLCSGSTGAVFASLAEHIEQLLDAA